MVLPSIAFAPIPHSPHHAQRGQVVLKHCAMCKNGNAEKGVGGTRPDQFVPGWWFGFFSFPQ